MSKKDETQTQQSFKAQVQQDIEPWLAIVERQTSRWQETIEDVAKASAATVQYGFEMAEQGRGVAFEAGRTVSRWAQCSLGR